MRVLCDSSPVDHANSVVNDAMRSSGSEVSGGCCETGGGQQYGVLDCMISVNRVTVRRNWICVSTSSKPHTRKPATRTSPCIHRPASSHLPPSLDLCKHSPSPSPILCDSHGTDLELITLVPALLGNSILYAAGPRGLAKRAPCRVPSTPLE